MVYIKSNSLILVIPDDIIDGSSYKSMLYELSRNNVEKILITIEPGYIVGKPPNVYRNTIIAIPQHTFIAEGNDFINICGRVKCYITTKPAWIRSVKIGINELIRLAEQLTPWHKEIIIKTGDRELVVKISDQCIEEKPFVVDGILKHNESWITGRIIPFNKGYREIIMKVTSEKPLKDIIMLSNSKSSIYIDHGLNHSSRLMIESCREFIARYFRLFIEYVIDYLYG